VNIRVSTNADIYLIRWRRSRATDQTTTLGGRGVTLFNLDTVVGGSSCKRGAQTKPKRRQGLGRPCSATESGTELSRKPSSAVMHRAECVSMTGDDRLRSGARASLARLAAATNQEAARGGRSCVGFGHTETSEVALDRFALQGGHGRQGETGHAGDLQPGRASAIRTDMEWSRKRQREQLLLCWRVGATTYMRNGFRKTAPTACC